MNYVVLSEKQTEWMRRVMKQMIELTGYYCFAKASMTDEDWDDFTNVFGQYTEKARGNGMIIDCANALADHLERTTNELKKYQKLDAPQLKQIEVFIEEAFMITGKWQEKMKGKEDLKKANQELLDCMEKYPTHDLVDDLSGVFSRYLEFCMEENIGKQLFEQKQAEKAGEDIPHNAEGDIEKKHIKTR